MNSQVRRSFQNVRVSPLTRSDIVALLTACAVISVGCAAGPTEPSTATPSNPEVAVQAATGHPSPTDLAARGWSCFQPPVPNRIVCSRPNQGFPAIPPPEDRPASFTFWVFNGAGEFAGTETLLRTDLYKGQLCESTGERYVFVPVIGYYECVHTVGQ